MTQTIAKKTRDQHQCIFFHSFVQIYIKNISVLITFVARTVIEHYVTCNQSNTTIVIRFASSLITVRRVPKWWAPDDENQHHTPNRKRYFVIQTGRKLALLKDKHPILHRRAATYFSLFVVSHILFFLPTSYSWPPKKSIRACRQKFQSGSCNDTLLSFWPQASALWLKALLCHHRCHHYPYHTPGDDHKK